MQSASCARLKFDMDNLEAAIVRVLMHKNDRGFCNLTLCCMGAALRLCHSVTESQQCVTHYSASTAFATGMMLPLHIHSSV